MAKIKGCQTPTSFIFLQRQEKKTLAGEAIQLYNSTGRTAQKWQENLLKHILSQNKDGLWVHTKFGYSLPRRNGKNEVVAMRELYGLKQGEHILHTAHRTSTSRTAWERLCKLLDGAEIQYKASSRIGAETIKIKGSEGKIDFRTRTSKGGLGEGFDLLVIDEAQEYMDDQESSLKYVVTDSKNPQTLFCGTPPTAVSSGTIFVKMRNACLQGETKNTGWAEWAVDSMTDPHDKEAWKKTNPSLGTIFTERSIEDEIGTDDVDFNIQRLGLWIKYNQKSAISEVQWNELLIDHKPEFDEGKLHVGIKFGKDGKHIALSIAVRTISDGFFVETLYCKPTTNGIGWIIDFLKKANYSEVVADGASGQPLLEKEMKENKLKRLAFPSVKEIIDANATFEQLLYTKQICHSGQVSLTQTVSNCQKRTIGSNGGFGYESIVDDIDIAIMDSMILALWSCQKQKERKPQTINY